MTQMETDQFSTEDLVTGAIASNRKLRTHIAELSTLNTHADSQKEQRAIEKAMNLLEFRLYLTQRYLELNE